MRAHTRVFVSDGGYFVFPLDSYEAIQRAKHHGDDYEGADAHGALTYLTADYIVAISCRTDETIADERAWRDEEKAYEKAREKAESAKGAG